MSHITPQRAFHRAFTSGIPIRADIPRPGASLVPTKSVVLTSGTLLPSTSIETRALRTLTGPRAKLVMVKTAQVVPVGLLVVLHNFDGSDGRGPAAALIVSSNTIYGTTYNGGASGLGTIFKVNTDGTGFTSLRSFSGMTDGAHPECRLLLADNALYGTTVDGGTKANGTVFTIGVDGTGFTNLYAFGGGDSSQPYGALVLLSNTLYGTTSAGGITNGGTVFAVNTDGSGFANLHNFNNRITPDSPFSGLLLSGKILYGTTSDGGGNGTVFALNIDGSGFTNLHSFNGSSDGGHPQCDLILSGSTLYGTTSTASGVSRYGTVFALNIDGTGFRTLRYFTFGVDGGFANSGLTSLGDMIYGVGFEGGSGADGTVYAMTSDGTEFWTLYSFSGFNPPIYISSTNFGGAEPYGALTVSGSYLYGTCNQGGIFGDHGTVFSISLQPHLAIASSDGNLTLTWPTNFSAFTLQSTTNLSVWVTNLPAPVVVNGQNVVTNPISGTQQFFRLSQ